MTPGRERAVWKLFGILADLVGHEHITENRDETIRFCRLAARMENRFLNTADRVRQARADAKLLDLERYLDSLRATVKSMQPGADRVRLEHDLRAARRVLERRK